MRRWLRAVTEHASGVMRSLGTGYSERVYHRAMIASLNQAGVAHRTEVPSPVYFQGEVVGIGRCDLVIGNVVVEIKANALAPRRALAQLRRYTENLGRAERRRYYGIVLNFNQRTGAVQTVGAPRGVRRRRQ